MTGFEALGGTPGERGAFLALRGDRYLPSGGVRHRTRPNFIQSEVLVAACGLSVHQMHWRGTGTQDEYEMLSSLPRCLKCMRAEAPHCSHDF